VGYLLFLPFGLLAIIFGLLLLVLIWKALSDHYSRPD
jgi:hypothetical protein